MLKTGTVPVSDQIQRVPAAPQDSESRPSGDTPPHVLTSWNSQGQDAGCGAGGRRRGRAAEAASRDGHVRDLGCHGEQIQCQQGTTRACPQTIGLVTEVDKETVQSRWARRTASGNPSATGVGVQEAAFVIATEIGGRGQDGGSQIYNFRTISKGLPHSLLISA